MDNPTVGKIDQLTLTGPEDGSENALARMSRVDPKQLRVEHVGELLGAAYKNASTLKLTRDEAKKLREDFPDTAVEIRPHDGIVYISHMTLRERLWEVFGPGAVAEICRERMVRNDSNEIAVDLVLMIRGVFVAEGIGTAKYYPKNQNTAFGDVVESAWSDALRRCCKKFGVGTQVWRPQYIRDWLADNAVQQGGKWYRKDDRRLQPAKPLTSRGRSEDIRAKGLHGGVGDEHGVVEIEESGGGKTYKPTRPERDKDDDLPF